MSKKKDERLPFKTVMAYSRRGLAIWWKAEPEILIAAAVQRAVDALAPFLPLYFTARLVNAIAAGGGAGQVWTMLALLLASTAAAGMLRAAVRRWDETMRRSHQWPTWNRIFFEKLLSMDFCDVDDPKSQTLFTQIQQVRQWNGWGLNKLYRIFSDAVGAVFRILGAAALSVSLFILPVPAGSSLAWLNNPGCLAGMLALLVGSVLASGALSNKSNSYWSKFDGAAGNRGFAFFFICRHGAAPSRYRHPHLCPGPVY